MGFQNVTVIKMLQHLKDWGEEVDFIDIQEMKKDSDAEWDNNEHIVMYFSKVQNAVKRLGQTGIKFDKKRTNE